MDAQLRHGLLLRTALTVLAEADGPVPSADVLAAVRNRLPLTAHECSLNASGIPRYDTFIRFATGWMKAIGWLAKDRSSGWLLTPAGREALAQYSDEELYRVSNARYTEQLKARKATAALRDAIDLVPEGFWTTRDDLAQLSGLSVDQITVMLAEQEIPGAHRVLPIDGTTDHRQALEAEGVPFVDGRAASSQRLTVEDLGEVSTEQVGATGNRAWLVRGSAVAGVNVVGRWLSDGFVSLAASHLRRVEPGISLENLRSAVEADYAHLTYNQRTAKLAELHAFLNRMSIGDAVVTTSEGRVYAGRIGDEAVFVDANDAHTTIRRQATWQREGVDFADLADGLQSRLKSSSTVVDLTELWAEVEAIIGETAMTVAQVPLRQVRLGDLAADVVQDLLVGADWLAEFVDLLRTRRQVILYGPPGTGKTFLALSVAEALTEPANVQLVQFHPAYSYEDFFEGYRPAGIDEEGRLGFTLRPGPLRKIVDQAVENPSTPFILIIDEINRANLARVFGELYFLLEYRDRRIELMYGSGDQGRDFTLPKNLFIVGTMNTADRSIALVDAAMRRRFAFLSLHPNDEHLRGVLRGWLEREDLATEPADLLDVLNDRIPDRDFCVGPSYLMRPEVATEGGLDRIWRTSILPQLEELHYGDDVDVARRYGLSALRTSIARATAEPEQTPSPVAEPTL
ncbi:MAG: AAA family ATPase [Kineosporiaceae bacterium]|nr:AAA family ATPase [Kineosporiaceae bacterium]